MIIMVVVVVVDGRRELELSGHNLTSVLINPREDMSELEVSQ